VKTKGS